ncbi:MAG: GNAT family N-acetyltransferase [Anaerolineae bacterium]|nr:GNAT family N-acetyltransferase [Anaerolineae bacterium]
MPQDILKPSLVTTAIETNQYALWLEAAQLTGHPWHHDPQITWVDCSPSPSPQGIFSARFGKDEAQERVAWVKSQVLAGKAPRLWMCGPSQQPDNLETILEQHGFVRRSETSGMALDLTLLEDDEAPPAGVEIHPVDRTNLTAWARVVGEGLFRCDEERADAFAAVIGALLDRQRVTAYLAYWQGEPASASMVYFAEGVAGIYYVATRPDFRSHGLGRAVTRAPLLQARKSGTPAAILHATESGARVYRKLGFQAYSLLGRYWLVED